MKKCAVFFGLFMITLIIAVFLENKPQNLNTNDFVVEEPVLAKNEIPEEITLPRE